MQTNKAADRPDVAPVLKNLISNGLLPDPAGKTVWDLGCGDGRFVEAFIELGAGKVLASDLSIPWSDCSNALLDDSLVETLVGGTSECREKWGHPVPADIVFLSLMLGHVSHPRQFFSELADAFRSKTEVVILHDNFFQR